MIRVMIVEDQKLVRSLLESYIQNEDGYQLAVSIPGAAEAPILCDTEDIDLVLMDVQTEHRENGLAAAKRYEKRTRKSRSWWRPRLLTQVLARAKAVGADSLWYKDGDEGTLMEVVRRTMAGSIFSRCTAQRGDRHRHERRVHQRRDEGPALSRARAVL